MSESEEKESKSQSKAASLKFSAETLEVLLMGVIAYWGDGKIVQEEMEILLNYYRANRKKLNFVTLTDPEDEKLSEKEFIIGLCAFLKSEEERMQDEDIELPEEFVSRNKKKFKDKELSSKEKVFIYLQEELGKAYDADYAKSKKKKVNTKGTYMEHMKSLPKDRYKRMQSFRETLEKLAKADGNFQSDERKLIELVKHETTYPAWAWITWLVILAFILKQCMD